jgi:tetratricopeptide (TPR) repeat protein
MFKSTLIFEPLDATPSLAIGSQASSSLNEEDRVWLTQRDVTITSDFDLAVSKILSGQILIVGTVANSVTPTVSKFLRVCQRHLCILPQWQIIVGDQPDMDLQALAMEAAIKTFWPCNDLRKTLAPWLVEQNKILTDKSEDSDRSLRIAVAIAQSKFEAIEKSLESLQSDAQYDFRVAFQLGVYFDRLGKTETSLQFFSKSLELNSKFLPAIYRRAQKMLETGKPSDALKALERLEMINPKNPDRKALMAQAHADLGDWQQAKSLRDQAITLEPDNPLARELDVRIAFESGDTAAALATLENCETTNDYFIRKLNAEAVRLSQNGQTDDALHLYERAWNIAPELIKFRISYNIALAHYRNGDFERAAVFCERAHAESTDPSFDKIAKLQKILSEKVA